MLKPNRHDAAQHTRTGSDYQHQQSRLQQDNDWRQHLVGVEVLAFRESAIINTYGVPLIGTAAAPAPSRSRPAKATIAKTSPIASPKVTPPRQPQPPTAPTAAPVATIQGATPTRASMLNGETIVVSLTLDIQQPQPSAGGELAARFTKYVQLQREEIQWIHAEITKLVCITQHAARS